MLLFFGLVIERLASQHHGEIPERVRGSGWVDRSTRIGALPQFQTSFVEGQAYPGILVDA